MRLREEQRRRVLAGEVPVEGLEERLTERKAEILIVRMGPEGRWFLAAFFGSIASGLVVWALAAYLDTIRQPDGTALGLGVRAGWTIAIVLAGAFAWALRQMIQLPPPRRILVTALAVTVDVGGKTITFPTSTVSTAVASEMVTTYDPDRSILWLSPSTDVERFFVRIRGEGGSVDVRTDYASKEHAEALAARVTFLMGHLRDPGGPFRSAR
jgi:hypothetical protein